MTRKHFIALADALRAERPAEHWDKNKMVQWELDCKAIAKACKKFNPKFDQAYFLDYCEDRI